MELTPHDLSGFTGSDTFTRHALNRKMVYTEGVTFFANKAGAYWFLDIVATELMQLQDKQPFIVVHLRVADNKAVIVCDDGGQEGNDEVEIYRRAIDFTDCPAGDWKFWLTDNTLLLPSEY